ncbi:uncharacterized protein RSE6_02780 [Rhynchosporium secalis]|uniref:NB-ARC domain-containing protein n=1 Tax=Rhynchosporium secalis TaxID=38038 RepID=A0A1E1M137_RHYSE|nr:uncharacterized protein RSE6_02780 [Rhynchosporium secalis]
MSGLEVLGAVSAATALAEKVPILSRWSKEIAKFKKKLEKTNASRLEPRFRKLKKSIAAVLQENDLKGLFVNLEREKLNLLLWISRSMSVSMNDGFAGLHPGFDQQLVTVTQPFKITEERFYLVPKRPVDCFISRNHILQKMKETEPCDVRTGVFVLRGLGGQGKTQIALEYCRQASERGILAIFWIDATSKGSVKKSFQTMAAKLKNTDTASAEDASPFMLEAFRVWPKVWVMVFDNYDDVKNFDSIRDYFPASKNGTIVVTSRNSASKDLTNHQPSHFFVLGSLSDEESVTLLQKRSQLEMAKIDTIAAKAIVNRLACHPLAIMQASSYISRKNIRLSQFLDHYEKSRA